MCTVTFIPSGDNLYITSNRDEKNRRETASVPSVYTYTSGRILFPKDGDANGTWIAVHENGNAVVFLNGAHEAHEPLPPYRKSRGLILIDLIDHDTPYNCFLAVKLNNIEPFTAIIRDNQHLFECRWDGSNKHYTELDVQTPCIWSSVTLYDQEASARRKAWFGEWLQKNPAPSQEDILRFHQTTGDGDPHNDLLMNRDGLVFTVSITSLQFGQQGVVMDYLDLQNNQRYSERTFSGSPLSGKE